MMELELFRTWLYPGSVPLTRWGVPGAPPPEEEAGETPDDRARVRSTAAMASLGRLLASWMIAGVKFPGRPGGSAGSGLLSV